MLEEQTLIGHPIARVSCLCRRQAGDPSTWDTLPMQHASEELTKEFAGAQPLTSKQLVEPAGTVQQAELAGNKLASAQPADQTPQPAEPVRLSCAEPSTIVPAEAVSEQREEVTAEASDEEMLLKDGKRVVKGTFKAGFPH